MVIVLVAYLILSLFSFVPLGSLNKIKPYMLAVLQLLVFLFFYSKYPLITNGEILEYKYRWISSLGLTFSLTLDGLSYIFALLISGVGFLVFLYATSYMKDYEGKDSFYFYLTAFSGAMMGLVLSSNLVLTFVFWELTSFLSFFLISFFNHKEAARKAAFQSLFITAGGGLALLIGLLLLGSITGSFSINDWISQSEMVKSHKLYLPTLLFILIGVFTKSAQFPFHFWLPGAMQAPTPVSSYLHSATMVKAGVYLLARLNPVLGGTQEWVTIIPLFGGFTFLVGAYFAITQRDLKAVLAYTTISALGLLVLLVGIDTRYSIKAALVFLFVHAFYKASLFMVAGIIDKKTGTRDITKLGELLKHIPLTSVVAILALLSMAGLPPMLGFIGKELVYEAKVQEPGIAYLVLFTGVVSNMLMVSISLFLIFKLFLKPFHFQVKPKQPGWLLITGPIVLVTLSVLMGVFPGLLNNMVQPALQVIRAEEYVVKLKLWHGFTNVFYLSLFTVAVGASLALALLTKKKLAVRWSEFNEKVFSLKFTDAFTNNISRFIAFSERNTKRIQHGSHRLYLLTIILFTAVLLWLQLYFTQGWEVSKNLTGIPVYILGVVIIMVLAVIFILRSSSRMTTIIALGVVGYGISIIYMYYSAIDLAITQIIVETLTLVAFVLILQKLPRFARLSSKKTKKRDLLVALIFGGAMTLLTLKAIHVNFNDSISQYFIDNSYIKAYGKNVVNVILVDFRALDTLGEVLVLCVAALGVYVLFRFKRSSS